MKNRQKNKKTRAEAIVQILILMIGIIAISWIVGNGVNLVSAEDEGTTTTAPSGSLNTCVGNYCSSRDLDGKILYGLYGGKLLGEKCVPDLTNFKQDCSYGCTDGASTCNFKYPQGGGNALLSYVPSILQIPSTIETSKKLLASKPKLPPLGSAEAEAAIKEALKEAGIKGTSWLLGGGKGVGAVGAMGAGGYVSIAAWSAIAFAMGRYVLGPWFGLNVQQSQSLGWALAGGTAAGLIGAELLGGILSGAGLITASVGIGLVFTGLIFIALAKKSSSDIIEFSCSQWYPRSGKGLTESQMKARCEMCNSQKDLVCTEYQCRSLGQGCILINSEDTGRQLCIWNNTKDITPPIITPWVEALLDDFRYTPDNAISPPDRGVKITYTGTSQVTIVDGMKCAPAFTPVSFGVQLDEAARCKVGPIKAPSYDHMADKFMGDRGIAAFNHSHALLLPPLSTLEAEGVFLDNGGRYEMYVRCEDANGNSNPANFVFKFCISEGPDVTPPLILGTSILDNQPIAYGQSSVSLDLYVRDQSFTKENASCKWSRLDKNYAAMENDLNCSHSLLDMNAQMAYKCKANLTGLKDAQINRFYFRCIDDLGNANTQPYVLNLAGTRPLIIQEVGPNGTIEDSSEIIKVELTAKTAAGYKEGKAICSFSETGTTGSYVDFFYGQGVEAFSQHEHVQELWLNEGNYNYYIRCRDEGGNIDDANVSFAVRIDKEAPIVVRIYKEEDYLKLVTNEPGRCVYSNFGCTYLFDDGKEMYSLKNKEYYAEWNIKTDFYIKCEDKYGNQPMPNVCSIIARPFEIFQVQ